MEIALAETDQQIAACIPVMRQLRPKVDPATFVADVRRMEKQGYRLAALRDPDGAARAVAGYRYMETLAFGPLLYVDDLVTDSAARSKGYGRALLSWLIGEARRNGCRYVTLDSGSKRLDAHHFYRREGMEEIALHFAITTDGGPMWTSD